MRDEFLLNCEKEILEANLFLMCGQHEEGIQATRKVLDAIMKEIVNGIQPITKNTQPYVIAALRALANGSEKQLERLRNNDDIILISFCDNTENKENYNKCRDSDRKQDRV